MKSAKVQKSPNKQADGSKTYKLKSRRVPLSFILASRNTKRVPLLYYDEDQNINRPLRYARNQRSPFEDEQDGNAILEPVIFENGFLSVPKTNPVLQAFLHYHPQNGIVFEEVNTEKDAAAQLEKINWEVDALIKAKELSIHEVERIGRVLFNRDTSRVTTAELRRDILVFARSHPHRFLAAMSDPALELKSEIRLFFDKGLLIHKNNGKEVWYNTPTNKKKMLAVPFGEDVYELISMYLKTDEGIESLKMLKHHLASE
jgi:hypothetical protein